MWRLAGHPPPLRPHAPALQALGLVLARGHWLETERTSDAAWAAEQALRSASCRAMLWWTPEASTPLHPGVLRRLHLLAQAGCSSTSDPPMVIVLRPAHVAVQASPAPLRLHCHSAADVPDRLQVRILKRRGPALDAPLSIDTRTQFSAALAHRPSQPLPQHRPMVKPAVSPPSVRSIPCSAKALARARASAFDLSGPSGIS